MSTTPNVPYRLEFSVEVPGTRLRMARIPDGATLIDNPVSKAPGFTIGNVHVMAGVPAVFEAMTAGLLPTLTGGRPLLSASRRIERPLAALRPRLLILDRGHLDQRQLRADESPATLGAHGRGEQRHALLIGLVRQGRQDTVPLPGEGVGRGQADRLVEGVLLQHQPEAGFAQDAVDLVRRPGCGPGLRPRLGEVGENPVRRH